MSIETAISREARATIAGSSSRSGSEPRGRDAVIGRDGRAGAERDHDRGLGRLTRLAGRNRRRGGSGVGIELGEERVGGLLALALAPPHHLAAPVVGDQREVVVLRLPADLVDPDVVQLGSRSGSSSSSQTRLMIRPIVPNRSAASA